MKQLKFRTAALLQNEEGKYLFIKEGSDRYWILPGGKKEAGETYLSACIRELKEELAITEVKLEFLYLIENRFKLNGSDVLETMVVFAGHYNNTVLNQEDEIKRELHWFNINELMELAVQPAGLFEAIYGNVKYIICGDKDELIN